MTVYERNKTMQFIGHQSPLRATKESDLGRIIDQIGNIFQAYTDQMKEEGKTSYNVFQPSIDIFLLGMTYGIRTNRRERRERRESMKKLERAADHGIGRII